MLKMETEIMKLYESNISAWQFSTGHQPLCELPDTLVWDQDIRFDQKPLNLKNTACKLDWSSLVNAAEAYESK